MKVREFAAAWEELVPGSRTTQTVSHNRLMVKPFVRRFGRRELGAVSPADATSFAASWPSHARYARTFMRDAQTAGLVGGCPFDGLRLQGSRGRADIDVLSEAQAWDLVAAVDDVYEGLFAVRFRALVATSCFSGIRACGAAGLTSDDIDDGRPVRLRVVEKGAKARTVVLTPPRACEALSEAQAHAVGGLVFRSRDRRPLNRWSIGRAFRPVKFEAGLPDITWHELRHFCASWMIDRGAQPIDVALQLHGRTDPDVVLRYYVHASRETAFERIAQVCA